jgi:hypothetical protein
VLEPLLQAFPFPSTTGEVTLHPLSQVCVFIYSSHGKWGLPPSPVEFSSFRHFHKLSHSSLLDMHPCSRWSLSGQAQLVYLQFWEGFPYPLFGAQGTPPSLPPVFIVLIAYYSVSLFCLGSGPSVQGAMLIWPRVVCGSTAYHLAHLVRVLPSQMGAGHWQRSGALLVSPFNVKWRFSEQAGGVKGSKFCLFSVALLARCVSSVSPRFHCRRHAFCFLPLAAILESLGFPF